ncbi:MAG: metallophosphoesterase family protein [Chloroflexi bacterium]|nr:metallophosphoesterase family protein [Chloroflexota bacterium]
MRVAVFSDIHGNAVALEAMLDDLKTQNIEQLVCLGDAIQGGPQPTEVVAHLQQLGCPIVMGNADDWLLTGVASDAEQISEARQIELDTVRDWQLSLLSEDDLSFIRTFQPTIRLPIDDERTLLCFHGSPQSFDHVILPQTPDEEVLQYLNPEPQMIYTGGHTHMQFIRHLGRTFHFNPGSVGRAYRHDQAEDRFWVDSCAEYAILTSNNGILALEFRRVPFDVVRLMSVYQTSGRPYAEEAIAQYGS